MSDSKYFLENVWKKSEGFLSKPNEDVTISSEQLKHLVNRSISVGPYYYYGLDFREFPKVTMFAKNSSLTDFFGIEYDDMSLELLFARIHPDDISFIQKCEELINRLILDVYRTDLLDFKASYSFRIKDKTEKYKLILHQMIPLEIDSKGNFTTSINIHTNIEHITTHNPRTISLFGFNGLPSFINIDPFEKFEATASLQIFTNREIEILRFIASGHTASQIADTLHLSVHTIRTHKRNILSKTDCKNQTELVAYCIDKRLI